MRGRDYHRPEIERVVSNIDDVKREKKNSRKYIYLIF
jgi:hypothetical protein